MKKEKENSHEGITWSEMGKQNVQAEKVYLTDAEISRLQFSRPALFFSGGFNFAKIKDVHAKIFLR